MAAEPASAGTSEIFGSARLVLDHLSRAGYSADERTAGVVSLAARLGKPVLLEGPAGTGKTQLAKSVEPDVRPPAGQVAVLRGHRRVESVVRVGLSETAASGSRRRAAGRTSTRTRSSRTAPASSTSGSCSPARCWRRSDPRSPSCCWSTRSTASTPKPRPCSWRCWPSTRSRYPELGRLSARHVPLVFLTSNGTRELSEALKRRCLFLYLDYPSSEREREIVHRHVPGLSESLGVELVALVDKLRGLDLRKPPSVSETIDFAQDLEAPGQLRTGSDVGLVGSEHPAQVPGGHPRRDGRVGPAVDDDGPDHRC